MSNTPGSNAASEINPGELTLFINDSVRGGCVFSLNHCLTWYKSFMEPHINHTPIIPSQGRCTGRSMGSRWREPEPELSPPKAASPTLPAWDGSSIPWAEPGSTMQGYAAHGWLQDSLPFLPAMFSPGGHHSPALPGVYTAQLCGAAASTIPLPVRPRPSRLQHAAPLQAQPPFPTLSPSTLCPQELFPL